MTELTNITLPYTPGSEFGGKILEVGAKCEQKLKPGDNVAVLSGNFETKQILRLEIF